MLFRSIISCALERHPLRGMVENISPAPAKGNDMMKANDQDTSGTGDMIIAKIKPKNMQNVPKNILIHYSSV